MIRHSRSSRISFMVALVLGATTVYAITATMVFRTSVEDHVKSPPKAPSSEASRGFRLPVQKTWGHLVTVDQSTDTELAVTLVRTMTVPPLSITATVPESPTRSARRMGSGKAIDRRLAAVKSPGPGGVMARFKAGDPALEEEEKKDLPRAPNRGQVSRVMNTIRSKVQLCYDRGMVPGQVDLVLTVDGASGQVKTAKVSATSSTATCIQRLARSLQFPRFAKDHVVIRYPYTFR